MPKQAFPHAHKTPWIPTAALLCAAMVAGCPSPAPDVDAGLQQDGGGLGDGGISSGDVGATPDAGSSGSDASIRCTAGQTRCEEGLIATCDTALGEFGPATDCPVNSFCSEGACAPVSDALRVQSDTLGAVAQQIVDFTGAPTALPMASALQQARRRLFGSAGTRADFAMAVTSVFNVNPTGHAALGFGAEDFSACQGTTSPYSTANVSQYGVCTRAAGDTAIITSISANAADNVLGLRLGERIVSVRTAAGVEWAEGRFLDGVNAQPICRSSMPNPTARREYAASSLFSVLRIGDTVRVRAVDGAMREVTVTAAAPRVIGCSDGLRRPSRTSAFTAYQRPDGVVVVVLPTLGSHPDHPFPTPLTAAGYRTWIAESIQRVTSAVTAFTGIRGLVYDLRGNTGGSPEYGLGLIAHMPAAEGSVGSCYARIPMSAPPGFSPTAEYPMPRASLGGDNLPLPPSAALPAGIRQAVVSDGNTYSAGDWMVWNARQHGIPVFGRPAAGAFGYQTGASFVYETFSAPGTEHDVVLTYISGAHCVSASGAELEGLSSVDTMVEFTGEDLAMGIDTQLEAAVASVLR